MKALPVLASALAALAACNTTPVKSLSYSRTPCLGACPVYTVTVLDVGRGVFKGEMHTAVIGVRNFQVTPQEFDRFVAFLQPLRPRSGTVLRNDPGHCDTFFLDAPGATVIWRDKDGQTQELRFSEGCGFPGKAAYADRLRKAPSLLPIGSFIE